LNHRIKLLIFVLCAVAVVLVLNVGYSALNTISRLNAVEMKRDEWQQPNRIVQALDLKPGNVVVDLGCGSGYFTLKLSSLVGQEGRVVAEDIRRLPLTFLWFRTLSKPEHNVEIVLGNPTDPRLPAHVNAVLILNTYHEFTDAKSILGHVSESLVAEGRLVVVDRAPKRLAVGAPAGGAEHEVPVEQVQAELLQGGFEVVSREDRLIDRDPDNETWWLITARKP